MALALLAGCGDGKAQIDGTVTLDGVPVETGSIAFVSENVREGAVIAGGRFHAAVPPGRYKLELNGTKLVGQRTQKGFDGKDETLPITEELFPPKFNVQSTLSEEIKPGTHPLKLDLKSK